VASDGDSDAPRAITRRGNGKRKADVDDLINLYAWFDAKKIVLPVFAATNLRRIQL